MSTTQGNAGDLELQDLQEELTVQNVILESLLGESFPGVEKERQEARREIQKLTRLVREKTAAQADRANDHAADTPAHERASPQAPVRSDAQGVHSNSSPPTTARMGTPQRPSDIWSSPMSGSLPSRKRERNSIGLSAGQSLSKSRRTTPTPSGSESRRLPNYYPSNFDNFDVIDLTGDDLETDASYIAEQIKQEKRQVQESNDRKLAMQLSSQEDRPGPSNHPIQSANAFAKLMGTQQSNALQVEDDDEFGSSSPSYRGGLERPPVSLSSQMPGSYDSNSVDDLFGPRREHSSAARSSMLGSMPMMTNYNAGAQQQYSLPGAAPNQHAWQSRILPSHQQALEQGRVGPPGMFPTFQQPADNLSSLINNTENMFRFGMPVSADAFDNPQFSDRLNNYLQEAYHDPRVTEKELDDLLKNIRPDMDIPERNRGGTPAGLKSSLYPHQELALTWMKSMEEGTNKGGILADDMGLGKTISTLALMLARPASSRPKSNLIIGPLSLVRQWEEEILRKTKLSHRMSVFIYHNKKATIEDMLKYDVILTTYGTVAQELKRIDKFYEEHADRSVDINDRAYATKFPLLHPKASFHRVILDEAQCIKNSKTKTAKACFQLKATHRWCLTGTPMMNGVLEMYSLVHFLRIRPYSDWQQFRQTFGVLFGKQGNSKHSAMTKLRALLKAIMLRRKKDSELDGKPIVQLPTKTEEVRYATLSADERDFYNQLEKKSQVQFSKYLRDGSIGKNYSNILVLLLRLRQACCHPHLNLDVDDVTPVSDEDMKELVKELSPNIVERIKAVESFECPICYDAVQSPSFFIPCGHDSCQQCLVSITENARQRNLQEGNESDRVKCPVCRGPFDPQKCFTYDCFKSVHMPETVEEVKPEAAPSEAAESSESDNDEEEDDDEEVNSKGNLKGFIVDDDDDDNDDKGKIKASAGLSKKAKGKNKKGKEKQPDVKPSMLKALRKEAYKNREAFKKYIRYLRKTWMPAAKVTECMNLLKEIQETGEKTIVFSQWTLLLDLLEVAMHHEGFKVKPKRYDGTMSSDQRNAAATEFRDKKDVNVMLVSLRAGNAGLNLTAASRVVIMDPFWNPYIEMQAVDRAYRIGQMNEVKVYRILTEDTVEDRIVELQNRKKEIVEAALDETESMKIGRLNVNELKFLFNGRN